MEGYGFPSHWRRSESTSGRLPWTLTPEAWHGRPAELRQQAGERLSPAWPSASEDEGGVEEVSVRCRDASCWCCGAFLQLMKRSLGTAGKYPLADVVFW